LEENSSIIREKIDFEQKIVAQPQKEKANKKINGLPSIRKDPDSSPKSTLRQRKPNRPQGHPKEAPKNQLQLNLPV